MKVKPIHRITAITLAFLMFFTSVGFSIDVHYCKGELKSFSLFGPAESCHAAKKICPRHAQMQMEEGENNDCCSNETVNVDDLDADFNVSPNVEFKDVELNFVTAYVYVFTNISHPKIIKSTYTGPPNPLPSRDIYVILERFLI